jgi:hypothetical protein
MERIELLRARIALYRRYLREGAEGDMASAYLWLIRRDEIEVAAIVASDKLSPRAISAARLGPLTQRVRKKIIE